MCRKIGSKNLKPVKNPQRFLCTKCKKKKSIDELKVKYKKGYSGLNQKSYFVSFCVECSN